MDHTRSYTPFHSAMNIIGNAIEEETLMEDKDEGEEERVPLRNINSVSYGSSIDNVSEKRGSDKTHSKEWTLPRKIKVAILTIGCIIMAAWLIYYPEEYIEGEILSVSFKHPTEIVPDLSSFGIEHISGLGSYLYLRMRGSFVDDDADHHERLLVEVGFNGTTTNTIITDYKTYDMDLTIKENTVVSDYFELNKDGIELEDDVNLVINIKSTTINQSVGINVEFSFLPFTVMNGVLYGWILLLLLYGMIIFEVAHRTTISMFMATASITVLAHVNERPSLEELLTWIDVETLLLLFSMMLIVSIVSETGVFRYMGYWSFKITMGKVWPLLTTLSVITAVVSAVLDNVTTILLMTPVVIQLCESISLDPIPILIAVCIFSNIGGASTIIGDPPNVLIANDPTIANSGISFGTFMLHMVPACLLVGLCTYLMLRFVLYRKLEESIKDEDIDAIKREIVIWNKTLQSVNSLSREERQVREMCMSKVTELQKELEEKIEEGKNMAGSVHSSNALDTLYQQCQITDKPLLIKSVVVLGAVIILFFIQNSDQVNLSIGWISFLGAITLLIVHDQPDIESIIARVEWTTLIFFATLFVIMEALNRLTFLRWIGNEVTGVIGMVNEDYRLIVAIVLIVWVSGIASAFVDNIPFTTMMIPVINEISKDLQLPLAPLVYALALATCLGGNGTLVGASANLVCSGVSEQHGYSFSFMDFFKVGMPITLMSLAIVTIYLIICHGVIGWNS